MLHFQYTEYLLSLAIVPVMLLLYFSLVRWKKKAAKKIGDPALVRQLTSGFSSKKFNNKFVLFLTGFALCALAVAGLVKPRNSKSKSQRD